jgi:hypothetical protein
MRNKLADLVDEVLRYLPWGEISQNTAKDVADHLIAKGVTIPTRCEDCRFWSDGVEGCTDNEKCCRIGYYMTKGNDYCAYGKRKITE